MSTILIAILILTDIITWMIIASVLMSWLGIKIKILDSILGPSYDFIEKYIPTKIWPLSFTPVVLIFVLYFIRWLVFIYDPNIQSYYYQIINF